MRALKALDFSAITDGYGFYAYDLHGLVALPQLLARPLGLGFGVETICLHANTMSENAIQRMIEFIKANHTAIIGFGDAIAIKAPSDTVERMSRGISQVALRAYRLVKG